MQEHKLVLGLIYGKSKNAQCVCVYTHTTVKVVVIAPCRAMFEINSPMTPHPHLVRNLSLQEH